MAPTFLWLSLSLLTVFAILLLLWRYQVAAHRARMRRRGRDLLDYLERR